ncbi:MAG: hypothetical protein ABWW69_04475 [Pyrodictiaceae archaeon]
MPCPWYKNGMCTSPKLPRPSSLVVSKDRCLESESEYKSCRFYVEPARNSSQGGLETHVKPSIVQQLKPYLPIHLIEDDIQSGCPFLKKIEYMGGFLAKCTVLDRLLTKSEARLCAKYWRDCPYYKATLQKAQQPL